MCNSRMRILKYFMITSCLIQRILMDPQIIKYATKPYKNIKFGSSKEIIGMTSEINCGFQCEYNTNCTHFYIKEQKSCYMGKLESYGGIDPNSRVYYKDTLKASKKSIFLQFGGQDGPTPLFLDPENGTKIETGCKFPDLPPELVGKKILFPKLILSPLGHFLFCTWNTPDGTISQTSCYRFPENTESGWKFHQSIFAQRYRGGPVHAFLPNGKYWFLSDFHHQIKTQYLDPVTMEVTNGIDLPEALYGPCVAQYNKSLTIITGGEKNDSTTTNTLRIYDWSTNNWKSGLPAMTIPRLLSGCGIYKNEKFIIVGGRNGSDETDICEAYNINANFWSSCGKLPDKDSRNDVLEVEGDLYNMAGTTQSNEKILKYNGGTNPSLITWIEIGTVNGMSPKAGLLRISLPNYFC